METTPRSRFHWLRPTPDHVVPLLLALEGLLLLAERFGWFTFDRHKGYPPLVAIAAVGAVFVLMLLWFLIALVFRRRFQFSLRSLLLLVVVVAIPCSWLATELKAAREQRAAVEEILKLGGRVEYDYVIDWSAPPPPKPPAPAWLCEWLGDELFVNVSQVFSKSNMNMDDFSFSEICDASLVDLKLFTQLRVLDLSRTRVSDAGLQHSQGT